MRDLSYLVIFLWPGLLEDTSSSSSQVPDLLQVPVLKGLIYFWRMNCSMNSCCSASTLVKAVCWVESLKNYKKRVWTFLGVLVETVFMVLHCLNFHFADTCPIHFSSPQWELAIALAGLRAAWHKTSAGFELRLPTTSIYWLSIQFLYNFQTNMLRLQHITSPDCL